MKVQQIYLADNSKKYDRTESNQSQFTNTANSVLGDILVKIFSYIMEPMRRSSLHPSKMMWLYSGNIVVTDYILEVKGTHL